MKKNSRLVVILAVVAVIVAIAAVSLAAEGQLTKGFLSKGLSAVKPLSTGLKPLSTSGTGTSVSITKAQMARLLTDSVGITVAEGAYKPNCFKDIQTLTLDMQMTICFLKAKGVAGLTDTNDGYFYPLAYMSRGQAATFLYSVFFRNGDGAPTVAQQYKDVVSTDPYYAHVQIDSYYKILDVKGGLNPLAAFNPNTELSIGRAKLWADNAKKNVSQRFWLTLTSQ
jgi:hypothetical protein